MQACDDCPNLNRLPNGIVPLLLAKPDCFDSRYALRNHSTSLW